MIYIVLLNYFLPAFYNTILDWATCGKYSKPRCFEVLVSDLHFDFPQNFPGV